MLSDLSPARSPLKPVALWLLVCCTMIFIMAVIGAITRLTESGLSIVSWHAVSDMLPPLDAATWQQKFTQYQTTPEYQKLNAGMDLAQFKQIYFWEWLHRLWGRLIGLVYAVPFLYFLLRKQIPSHLLPRFFFFLILGGLQGFVGWYMVKSGLIHEPRVSHYRLALHLGLAFIIFAVLWRQALELIYPKLTAPTPLLPCSLKRHNVWAIMIASITILWGVFVAGLDAGLVYNDPQQFPLMGQHLWPSEGLDMQPVWKNLFDNHATVQFIHRLLASITFIIVAALAVRCRNIAYTPRIRCLGLGLLVMISVQLILGITTLLTGVSIHVAAAHQAGALVVLALLIWQDWELRRYPAASES